MTRARRDSSFADALGEDGVHAKTERADQALMAFVLDVLVELREAMMRLFRPNVLRKIGFSEVEEDKKRGQRKLLIIALLC